jgi:hypothetical protein
MKEEFIHYLWRYKKFHFTDLKTSHGEDLIIVSSGDYLQKEGPDFFNAQIIISNQKWAGNIEIHIKSSDWYLHHHETDLNYNNIVLHVVWHHDAPIYRKDNTEIPVLEIKKYVSQEVQHTYKELSTKKSWIFCENQIQNCDSFVFENWQERLFLERLELKAMPVHELLLETHQDWEAVLFCMLAKNFGLNTNGDAFYKIAKSITFSLIQKEALEVVYLEALLYGQANLIPETVEDSYPQELKSWYDYLSLKYKLSQPVIENIQFFQHRPDNFPTIRLAQLAMLYHLQRNLFSKIVAAKNLFELQSIFELSVSGYWKTHYNFDKPSPKKDKSLSKDFINLLIINTIIPIKFAFAKSQGKENAEILINLLNTIPGEKNNIIEKFSTFGINSKNAFQTQALLQLKNEYCNLKKCLQCAIGLDLLKNKND